MDRGEERGGRIVHRRRRSNSKKTGLEGGKEHSFPEGKGDLAEEGFTFEKGGGEREVCLSWKKAIPRAKKGRRGVREKSRRGEGECAPKGGASEKRKNGMPQSMEARSSGERKRKT